jgi:Trk K+ transport system NAD-binding subunit
MDGRGGAPAGGHVVLCGLNELGYRTLEELVRGARDLGATLVAGNYRDQAVLRAAGVPAAGALVVTEDDDVGNLHAALAAQELNPALRMRLRMFNQELGRRVQELFEDCQVFDSAALAVPAFVSAALLQDWQQRVEVDGRLRVTPRSRAQGRTVAELESAAGSRVLQLDDGHGPRWRPDGRTPLDGGAELVAVVPRGELGRVLAWTDTAAPAPRPAHH